MTKLSGLALIAAAAFAVTSAYAGDKEKDGGCCAKNAKNDAKMDCSQTYAKLNLSADQKTKMDAMVAKCNKSGCTKESMDEFMKSLGVAGGNVSDLLKLRTRWEEAFSPHAPDPAKRSTLIDLLELATKYRGAMTDATQSRKVSGFAAVLEDPQVRKYLNVHEFEGTSYYSKEAFDEFIDWLGLLTLARSHDEESLTTSKEIAIFKSVKEVVTRLRNLSNSSEYRYEVLQTRLQKNVPTAASPVL